MGAAVERTGELTFLGSCTDQLSAEVAEVGSALGLPADLGLVLDWARARASGQAVAYEQAERGVVLPRSTDVWMVAPANMRSLRPADVPEDLRPNIDVRAVYVDLDGLAAEDVVVLRTSTGVSAAIGPPAMRTVLPAYLFAATDTEIEVGLGTPTDLATLRATTKISISDIPPLGGVMVDGDATRALRAVAMPPSEVATALGVSVAELAGIRASLLDPSQEGN
jgi:hypothetical protein